MPAVAADNVIEVPKRKPPKTTPPATSPREGQTALMVYVATSLSERLDAFIAAQPFKPSKRAVIEQIIGNYLTEHGFPETSK